MAMALSLLPHSGVARLSAARGRTWAPVAATRRARPRPVPLRAAAADDPPPPPPPPAAGVPPPAPAADALAAAEGAPPAAAKPGKAPSKPRLPGLDSLRFFLIAYIGVGHFISFATRDAFILKLMSQVNVWVGAFFVLSGYVAAYASTEIGKYAANARVAPASAYTVARVAGFYPLFLLANVLFGPMFAWADATYNGPLAAAFHGLLTFTLTQAWFPAHAEVWNAPTWFLSALTFALVALPHILPWAATLRRRGLWKLLGALTVASLLGKVAYSYDLNAWGLLEGVTPPKAHPNQLLWNVTRFHPFYALLEVLMGAAAARLVMLDGVDDDGKPAQRAGDGAGGGGEAAAAGAAVAATPGSVALPALGLLAVTWARAAGALPLNDPLTRALLFVPLFIALVQALHRNTVAPGGARGLAALLGSAPLVYLGAISFPIFVLHGPLGQVFYKKIIATQLWGGVMGPGFFPVYCAAVVAAAVAVQHLFLENKKVQEITAAVTKKITAAL